MDKIKVAVIDSGIENIIGLNNAIKERYGLITDSEGNCQIIHENEQDYFGHGTAVTKIIYDTYQNVEITMIRIFDNDQITDEVGLIYALEYIYSNLNVDLINISAGLTYLSRMHDLENVCIKLNKKGIYIVSAFDNMGAISYPAAFDSVIGVDVTDNYISSNDIVWQKNSIVDIIVPNVYYRTWWGRTKTIIKGSSFACAKITGLIAREIAQIGEKKREVTKMDFLEKISSSNSIIPKSDELPEFSMKISKAIVFPFNKETQSLLRYQDLLNFEIIGVYDERLKGNIGKMVWGIKIQAYEEIDWNADFDTIIFSCSSHLAQMTKRNYEQEILSNSKIYNKRIYSFEMLKMAEDKQEYYYPELTSNMVPRENAQKLHKTLLPIVGVFGTSSSQGKYTLQLSLLEKLKKMGYNTGFIATEPSGYLFGADSVFHFGYKADISLYSWECISIINEMIWNAQNKGRDILITGCQSNIIHYDNSHVNNYAIYQYAYALGVMADFCILCVNPHDELSYIERSIALLNAISERCVKAITVFPVIAIETLSGIEYKKETIEEEKVDEFKNDLSMKFDLPVYQIGKKSDMEILVDQIIDFFAE